MSHCTLAVSQDAVRFMNHVNRTVAFSKRARPCQRHAKRWFNRILAELRSPHILAHDGPRMRLRHGHRADILRSVRAVMQMR
jgi:hypothetical protein